jgi:ribosomal-protein-alanine N-acetyltransferase
LNTRQDSSTTTDAATPASEPLRLVPGRPEHAPLWHRWRSEAASQRFNPLFQLTVDELAHRLKNVCSSDLFERRRSEYRWMIECGTEIIGTVSAMNLSWSMGYVEIGYMLGEEHHGRGHGTRAVALLVEKLFGETRLHRVYATVSVENDASIRLLERLGFTREGVMREHYLIQGRRVDEVIYGLLRPEWEAHPFSLRAKDNQPL